MDNCTGFRYEALEKVLENGIYDYFRATYQPSGNGIVEKHQNLYL